MEINLPMAVWWAERGSAKRLPHANGTTNSQLIYIILTCLGKAELTQPVLPSNQSCSLLDKHLSSLLSQNRRHLSILLTKTILRLSLRVSHTISFTSTLKKFCEFHTLSANVKSFVLHSLEIFPSCVKRNLITCGYNLSDNNLSFDPAYHVGRNYNIYE